MTADLPEAPGPLRARLYAALHVGTPGDVEFYLRACKGATKILEYGCGAGRIAVALAERGHTVLGVDLDPALLALAHAHKAEREAALGRSLPVTFVLGDMTAFAKRGHDRVVIPYSAFWCLTGTEAKRQCLAKARASLTRQGQLVFDVYDADVMADEDFDEYGLDDERSDEADDRDEGAADVSAADVSAAPAVEQDEYEELHRVRLDGVVYRVWERNTWHRRSRLMQVDYRLIPAPSRKRSPAVATGSGQAASSRKVTKKSALAPDSDRDSERDADRGSEAKAAPRRGLAPRRSLAAANVSQAAANAAAASAPEGYQLTLRHSVLWRHELAELLEEARFDVEWGVDEEGEQTPFSEQVVVRAVRA
jgi:SAM-dependent methyltransferase